MTAYDQSSLRLEHPLYAEWLRDQLGPMVQELYDELAEHCDDAEADPVVRIDWFVRAGRRPDPNEAAAAVRLALARTDRPRRAASSTTSVTISTCWPDR